MFSTDAVSLQSRIIDRSLDWQSGYYAFLENHFDLVSTTFDKRVRNHTATIYIIIFVSYVAGHFERGATDKESI